MATLMERLTFLQKVPTLMKATADDETACPGYLFEQIVKFSHESAGCCQCLLEYLLERLQTESCYVKLKVLKILQHLCVNGSDHFLTELHRNATFIQEVTVFSGPPDPVHGTVLYQRVRSAAQELAGQLFMDTLSPRPALSPCRAATPSTGMGSESAVRSGMRGFGYSPARQASGGGFLDKIQKAAEVVASAVLPPAEHPGIRLHDNRYRAVTAPALAVEIAVPACLYGHPSRGPKARRCPGLAGGGWEDIDSGHSSHNSSQENGDVSHTSVAGSSRSGTDSQSGASRESGDLSERAEGAQLGDCVQEMALVSSLTEGFRVFLSREEMQHFIKECAILNCEVVVELLARRLVEPVPSVQMRAMCAIACLMSTDLLSLDDIFGATQKSLVQLSKGSPGPVSNKAIKLLRQFEALMGGASWVSASCPEVVVRSELDTDCHLPTAQGTGSFHLAQDSTLDRMKAVDRTGWELHVQPTGGAGHKVQSGVQVEPPLNPRLLHSNSPMECDGQAALPPAAGPAPFIPTERPSLFSGMDLVIRVKPTCAPMSVLDCEHQAQMDHEVTSPHPQNPESGPQQLSAFSFLNA